MAELTLGSINDRRSPLQRYLDDRDDEERSPSKEPVQQKVPDADSKESPNSDSSAQAKAVPDVDEEKSSVEKKKERRTCFTCHHPKTKKKAHPSLHSSSAAPTITPALTSLARGASFGSNMTQRIGGSLSGIATMASSFAGANLAATLRNGAGANLGGTLLNGASKMLPSAFGPIVARLLPESGKRWIGMGILASTLAGSLVRA
jgi:hypothetical protein